MNPEEIKDVLTLRDIVANAEDTPGLISALMVWRDSTVAATPVPQHVPSKEPLLPEEVVEPEPVVAPPKPTKSRSRTKTPPPPADDDDADF